MQAAIEAEHEQKEKEREEREKLHEFKSAHTAILVAAATVRSSLIRISSLPFCDRCCRRKTTSAVLEVGSKASKEQRKKKRGFGL